MRGNEERRKRETETGGRRGKRSHMYKCMYVCAYVREREREREKRREESNHPWNTVLLSRSRLRIRSRTSTTPARLQAPTLGKKELNIELTNQYKIDTNRSRRRRHRNQRNRNDD